MESLSALMYECLQFVFVWRHWRTTDWNVINKYTVFLYCFVYVYSLYAFVYFCKLRILLLRLCIRIVMYVLFSIFCFHRANWHSSATLTEGFPCFSLSCKANARV